MLGCSLESSVEHAHHVVPNQSGDPEEESDDWLRGVDNCVILCSTCHNGVHQDGNFRSGGVAPPSYFTYSSGKEAAAEASQCGCAFQLSLKANAIWQRLSES